MQSGHNKNPCYIINIYTYISIKLQKKVFSINKNINLTLILTSSTLSLTNI